MDGLAGEWVFHDELICPGDGGITLDQLNFRGLRQEPGATCSRKFHMSSSTFLT